MAESNRFRKLAELLKYLDSPGAATRSAIYDAQAGELPDLSKMGEAFMDPNTAPSGVDIAERANLGDDAVLANTFLATAADMVTPLEAGAALKPLAKSERFRKLMRSMPKDKTVPQGGARNMPLEEYAEFLRRNDIDSIAKQLEKRRIEKGIPFDDQGVLVERGRILKEAEMPRSEPEMSRLNVDDMELNPKPRLVDEADLLDYEKDRLLQERLRKKYGDKYFDEDTDIID